MHRLGAILLAVLIAIACHAPARASGDFSCSPSFRLSHVEMTGCDNMAILQPGNDTRVNLALLLSDLRGSKGSPSRAAKLDPLFDWSGFVAVFYPDWRAPEDPSYADGEGSRCRSNPSGAAGFESAVNAAGKVPAAERAALIAARRGLQPSCTGASGGAGAITALDAEVKSPSGKAFAAYLKGALAFYDADYGTAATQFATARAGDQPWLKETARYMLGRVEVNRLQVDAFDEYGMLNQEHVVDAKALAAAEGALRGYLHDYLKGAYTASARGLLRRVYWLANQPDKLAAEYVALFAQTPAQRGLSEVDLIQEIDNKLLVPLALTARTDPILLAVLDLQAMRHTDGASDDKPMPVAQIEAQRASFAGNQPLFDYLLAAHALYVAHKPAEVLRLIPDAARQSSFSYTQFSRQMVRGMALEALGDRNARGFWNDLLGGARQPYQRQAVELALAMHDERSNALARVFEPASPVRTPIIRAILLANVAGPSLLRQQAKDQSASSHERELALFTLLYKGVSHGAYRDFLGDLAMVPPNAASEGDWDLLAGEKINLAVFTKTAEKADFACPQLRETATQLARDAGDAHARLCLGEFMRNNGFDQFSLDTQPPKSDLGGSASLFPGTPYSRLEVYKAVMADPRAAPPDKAYALYRAVRCYAPSGNNSCGGKEVPTSQRKAWYDRLKKDYPTSPWAKSLHLYW
jgi:hypothetical protein